MHSLDDYPFRLSHDLPPAKRTPAGHLIALFLCALSAIVTILVVGGIAYAAGTVLQALGA